MKAIAIYPKQKGTVHLIELEKPKINDNEVLVKVLQTGICKTDLEIYDGLYGESPKENNFLIMGHESLGIVEEVGNDVNSFKKGDYVVRTVRRPCPENCINCINNENDMCLTGNYTEIGIKGLHGIMVEYYKENPNFLVKIPKNLKEIGVLLEPLSFAEKTIRQAFEIQKRLLWKPKKALVLGSGPIGIFLTLILRNKGLDVYAVAKSKKGNLKSQIIEESGSHYISTSETKLETLPEFDIIVEATGNSEMVYEALKLLNKNGVLCLTSITGGNKEVTIPIDKINLDLVLSNKTIVGVVNANMKDYKLGIKHFQEFEEKWPGLLNRIITKEIRLNNFKEAFIKDRQDIKTVINF